MGIKVVHFYVFVQLRVSTSVAISSKSAGLTWSGGAKLRRLHDAM